jgi:uncharacterized membrane protein
MESRAKLFGHPVHQMLVTFPIGAFGLSVASDALHALTGERKYAEAAQLALDFGLVSSAAAIPFGWIDWHAIPWGTRPKRIGLWHALGNLTMVGLFGVSRWLRNHDDLGTARLVSGAAFGLSGVGAWLGGELIDRHGIGVELMDEAVSNAPLPASGVARPIIEETPTERGPFAERYHDGGPS